MTDLMRTLLTVSLTGSLLALALALTGRLLKNRLPKAAIYYLWLPVLLRLCLPWAVFGPGVELPLPEAPAEIQAQQSILTEPGQVFTLQTDPIPAPEGGEYLYSAISTPPAPRYEKIWQFLCDHFVILWLAGASVHFLWFAGSYLVYSRRLKQGCTPLLEHEQALLGSLCKGRPIPAFRSAGAKTPMALGLARPCILLPDVPVTARQLEHILRHELTHLQVGDLWIKWLAVAVTSLHWFNPCMPWIRREMSRWCELACDESVLRTLEEGQREEYGRTLLALAADHALPRAVPATTLVEEKRRLKERLAAILTFKQATGAVLALCLALMLVFTGCAGILGPAGDKQPADRPVLQLAYKGPDWVQAPEVFDTWLTNEELDKAVELIDRWQAEHVPDLAERILYLRPHMDANDANTYVLFSEGLYCLDVTAGEIKPVTGTVEDTRMCGLAFLRGKVGDYERSYTFYLSLTGQMTDLNHDTAQLKQAISDTAAAHPAAKVERAQLQLRNGALEYAQVGFDDGAYRSLQYNGPTGVSDVTAQPDRRADPCQLQLADLAPLLEAVMAWQREHDPVNAENYNAGYNTARMAEMMLKSYEQSGDYSDLLGLAQYSLSTGKITLIEDPALADCSAGVISLLYPAQQPTWMYLIGE